MKLRNRIALIIVFILSLTHNGLLGQSYQSKQGDVMNPHWYISMGGYFPSLNTAMRVDSERGLGTEVNLENDFKLDESISAVRFSGIYRLKKRSQFVVSYTNLNRQKSFSLERDIKFSDTTFYANAKADLTFDVNYYGLTYRYAIFDETNWNAGISAGLRVVQFKTDLKAALNSMSYSKKANVYAPALLLGVHGGGYLTPRLLARYSLEYFQLSVSGIDIRVLETQMSLQYFITENFGVGGGYATSNFKVRDVPIGDDFQGKIDFSFEGFTLFLTARI